MKFTPVSLLVGFNKPLYVPSGLKNELFLRQKKRWSIDLSIVLFPKGVEMLKFTALGH